MIKIFRLAYIAIVAFMFVSCGESIEDKMNKKLSEMSELSELGTVEYTISKIIKANDNSFYTIGDRKILFSCKATMKAGIDLSNFSSDNVPSNLAKFCRKYGVEIRFCDDIRSYKKLVPALELCPNDILVTVDDDIVYKRGFLKCLYDAHLKYPNHVLSTLAHCPVVEDKQFLPYKNWKHNITRMGNEKVFPLGCGGILYPPASLYKDVTCKDLFMKIAPQADDVWFWAMAVMAGTKHRLVDFGYSFYHIDLLYQKLHKGSSLMSSNLHEDCNDVQIKRVMEYYDVLFDKWSEQI
jgi:hypothetical protein